MKPEGYHVRLALPEAVPMEQSAQQPVLRDAAFGAGLACLDLGAAGMVLGQLFDSTGMPVRRVHPATARRWCATGGRALLRDYWGRYLAILRVERGLLVLRDPSGCFPCFWQQQGSAFHLASDMAWARSGGMVSGGVDWAEIRAQLHYRHRRSARTALRGVAELPPGCALRLTPKGLTQETLWSPYDHGHWDTDLRFETAADRLRAAVRTALTAEARQCAKPLISLSGGLDSSIVTAGFAEANPGSACLTLRGGAADLDEAGYAESVARHYGLALHHARLDPDLVDLQHSAAADLPYPNARSFSQAEDLQTRAVAAQIGADAFILGNGGDTIFWYFNTATAAVDRLRAQGPGPALASVNDLARMCEVSRTAILRSALGKLPRHGPRPWPCDTTLLGSEGREPALPPPHPWESPSGAFPLGVHAYVRALIQLQAHHGYFDRSAHAPVRSVLMAQPIYEACLGLPSWLSARDGRNRAVARAAFADFLPPAVIARQSKGGFDGFVHQMLARNRTTARQMLVGGILAQHRMIDTPAIDALLGNDRDIPAGIGLRLLRFLAVEAWLRQQSIPASRAVLETGHLPIQRAKQPQS